jgi:hypothetical protein
MIFSDRISKSARAQLFALVALARGAAGLAAQGAGQARVGKSGRDSILVGKGVEGGRRRSEEVALGIEEISAVLHGPDPGKQGCQSRTGTGGLIVGEPGLAGGLLHGQLGALLVAEQFE